MTNATQRAGGWIPRILLLLCALILCLAGITGAMGPEIISGDAVLAPDGVTSIRVDFGGFHLGLGLFALCGVLYSSLLKPGLLAMAITMTLVVLTRVIGLSVDGATDVQFATLSREAIPFVLSLIGLFVLSRTSAS